MRPKPIPTRTLGCIVLAAWSSAATAAQPQPAPPATAAVDTDRGNGTITVISPNGGEVWTAGTAQTITWTGEHLNLDVVLVTLLRSGSFAWSLGFWDASEGPLDFLVCSAIGNGTDFTVRIEGWDACGQKVLDESDAPFSITGSAGRATLTVTSPNGGETWTAGSTQAITWTSTGDIGEVEVQLLKNGQPSAWSWSVPGANGRIDWPICAEMESPADYSVRIWGTDECGQDVSDESDQSFAITGSSSPPATLTLTSPVGGETFTAGQKLTITWTSTLLTGRIFVNLNMLGEGNVFLGWPEVSDGKHEWTIPPAIGDRTNYTISLETTGSCGEPLRSESALFAITGSVPPPRIKLTSPIGGESWTAGSTHKITWTGEHLAGNVTVRLCRDGHFYPYIGVAPASAGGFDWTICPTIGDDNSYVIEILGNDGLGDGTYDRNDAPFRITGSAPLPMLTVTGPDGGEKWSAGSWETVTWVAGSSLDSVRITLWKGGDFQALLGWAYASDGKSKCLLPATVGDGTDYTVALEAEDTCGGEFARAESVPFTITRATHGDFDRDSDVDLDDFQHFTICFNGPNRPPLQTSCTDADIDSDADVDLADFLTFQACFNGSNRPPRC